MADSGPSSDPKMYNPKPFHPKRRAHWKLVSDQSNGSPGKVLKCSSCSTVHKGRALDFCPGCGATMDNAEKYAQA